MSKSPVKALDSGAGAKPRVYTEEQISEFKQAFDIFDKEGKGFITVEEINKIVTMFGSPSSKDAIEMLMKDYDVDSNGQLDFTEFLKMMAEHNVVLNEIAEDNIKTAFKAFDKDHSGYLEKTELLQIMRGLGEHMTEKDVEDMIREGDLDEDGRINLEEFMIMMMCK